MYCSTVLCVLLLHHVYWAVYVLCVAALYTLDDGLLAKGQYPEGPATGHLDTSFSWFPCVCLQANAQMVLKTASCYCMLLMQPSWF